MTFCALFGSLMMALRMDPKRLNCAFFLDFSTVAVNLNQWVSLFEANNFFCSCSCPPIHWYNQELSAFCYKSRLSICKEHETQNDPHEINFKYL